MLTLTAILLYYTRAVSNIYRFYNFYIRFNRSFLKPEVETFFWKCVHDVFSDNINLCYLWMCPCFGGVNFTSFIMKLPK